MPRNTKRIQQIKKVGLHEKVRFRCQEIQKNAKKSKRLDSTQRFDSGSGFFEAPVHYEYKVLAPSKQSDEKSLFLFPLSSLCPPKRWSGAGVGVGILRGFVVFWKSERLKKLIVPKIPKFHACQN